MLLRENEIGGRIAPHLRRGWTVLDIGSGTGRVARWLTARAGIRPTLADVIEFGNRIGGLPYIRLEDPVRLPFADGAFDAAMMLVVLHHVPRWADQERLLSEAARVARRLVLIEDTPGSRSERAVNVAWDWLLNLRHGVPKPFTFRTVDGWIDAFHGLGLEVRHRETYRPMWPTLKTYHHTLFVLEPEPERGRRGRNAGTGPGVSL